MSDKGGNEKEGAAKPAVPTNDTSAPSTFDPAPQDPRHAAWIAQSGTSMPLKYDYKVLNMTEAEHRAAQGDTPAETPGDVLQDAGWAMNAKVYEWSEDYGDVGPAHPVLEKQLFGSDVHVLAGVDFSSVTQINVVQEGPVRINPVRAFDDAGLHPVMRENVRLAGYKIPTPIQAYTMPAIFRGVDIVACAQTGSGKTAAFLIPTLSKLMGKAKKLCAPRPNPVTFVPSRDNWFRAEPLVLIVCPSRELAVQIFNEARRFCYRSMLRPCVVYGGGPRRDQLDQIAKGCDVLIGTPGRLVDFITNDPNRLSLCRLKYMIIDEADEMLSADWETEFDVIMNGGDQEVGNITYMMFSATFPRAARDIAKEHLANDYCRIRVGRAGSSHMNIEQHVVYVEPSAKRKALLDLLYSRPPARTIVFVNNKRGADEVDDFLYNLGMPCTSIHSNRTQREREDALRAFRIGTVGILVATGISARGLDIKNVMHVINYDLPSTDFGGIEEYTHRIGRTARIGNKGLATSFYCDKNEDLALDLVKTLLETQQGIPDFLRILFPEDGPDELKFELDSDFGDEEFSPDFGKGEDGEGPSASAGTDVGAIVEKVDDLLINVDNRPTPVAAPAVAHTLPGMGPSVTRTLPGMGPAVVAPTAAPAVARTLPGMGPSVARTLPGMGPSVARTLSGMAPAVVAPVANVPVEAPAPAANNDKGKGMAVKEDVVAPAAVNSAQPVTQEDDGEGW